MQLFLVAAGFFSISISIVIAACSILLIREMHWHVVTSAFYAQMRHDQVCMD